MTSVANLIKKNIQLQCQQQMNSVDAPTTSQQKKDKPVSDKPCKCKNICVNDRRCNCFRGGSKCTNQCHQGVAVICCQNKDLPTKSTKRTTNKK